MRASELLKPTLTEASKGREFNHLEDLVFFYGLEGANRAVNILQDFATSQKDLTVKWDGKLSVYYGRDETGRFMLATVAGWRKNEPRYSGQEIKDYVANAGKGEEWRGTMAADLEQTFAYLEQATPTNFRQFVKGDLIFSPILAPKQSSKAGIQFTPAQVTYTANPQSEVGRKIANAEVGIALHVVYNEWGAASGATITPQVVAALDSNDVVAFGQSYVPQNPKIDMTAIKQIQSAISKNGSIIDELVGKRKGLADMANIFYTFINQTSRNTDIRNISPKEFFNWLPNSKVSVGKQAKIQQIAQDVPNAFPAFFELVHLIMNAKNDIIDQLDSADTDIKSNIGDQTGGEGYMSLKHNVKLVPRHKWRLG